MSLAWQPDVDPVRIAALERGRRAPCQGRSVSSIRAAAVDSLRAGEYLGAVAGGDDRPAGEGGARGGAPGALEAQGVGREDALYARRYSPRQVRAREHTWEVLCRDFLQPYVAPTDTVVDLGAGEGFFIRNIRAARRIAVDLSQHCRALEAQGIEVMIAPATDFARHLQSRVDVVFMSNLLEHLPSKRIVLDVLEECHGALRPGGLLLVLQPSIRYVGPAYWDYIDHHIALTEHSLVEALEVTGFTVERLIPRFLPYTAKSALGNLAFLVRIYLRVPFLWRIFGQQSFAVARAGGPARR